MIGALIGVCGDAPRLRGTSKGDAVTVETSEVEDSD